MKIAAITPLVLNVSARTNWFFLKAVLEDGTHGYGEASLNGWERPMLAYLDDLRPQLVGKLLAEARLLLRVFPQSPGGLIANAIRSGIEQALLDAEARARSVPIHALLGAKRRDRVRVYANINRATTDRTPAGCARSARAAVADGFTAVKIAPFDGVIRSELAKLATQRAIDAGIERVHAIREAVGPSIDVMVDCHWRFDEATARHVLHRLQPVRIFWFECPVPEGPLWQQALARLRQVAHAQRVLLAGAETQTGLDGFRPLLDPAVLDVVMPDVKYAGGIRTTLEIAELASRHGVMTSPHNPTGPVCTYASLHAAACAPDVPLLELQVGESALYFDVVAGARPAFENGCFCIPTGAGLGVDLDEDLVRAHPYQPVPYGPEEQLG